LPFNGSSSGHALLSALSDEMFERTVIEAAGDRGLTPERAQEIRTGGYAQLLSHGTVTADPAEYFAAGIHAVAKPFHSRDLSEPVIFTCGAMPADLSVERMRDEVGPALNDAVRELERMMGQGSAIAMRG
jgi:DNA-binding IclR family transcriptional regulator